MKTIPATITLAFSLLSAVSLPHAGNAQGSLTPPGAPAPLFKTLQQIEPRIAVQTLAGDATAQFVITNSGSYYLTGNVTGAVAKAAIAINADNVSLDLGGHMLIGVAGATRGIEIRGVREQIVIENGSIRGFDTAGVSATSAQKNLRIERLSVSAISAGSGIVLSTSSTAVLIRGCAVSDITGGSGILISSTRGAVAQCVVTDCTWAGAVTGITAQNVTDCDVSAIVGTGSSMQGILASAVKGCTVNGITHSGSGNATGISAGTILGCHVIGVTTSSGAATGINGLTVEASSVAGANATAGGVSVGITASGGAANCRAVSIGNATTSWGTATGIIAATAQGCAVLAIGGVGSSNAPTGINASTVANCSVSTVGNAGSSAGAVGISGSAVSSSTVLTVAGGSTGSVIGIDGDEVSQCSVSSITQAGGIFNCSGIVAEVITDCRVSTLSTAGTANVVGLASYRLARNCTVSSLSVSGGGDRIGAGTSQTGRTEGVVVSGNVDTGITVVSGHTIIGCTIGTAVTGIYVNGTKNVIDGNNLTGTGTTGISVTSGINTSSALVIRNQVRNYTVNFLLDTPCQSGPVISATGAIVSTSPWANFTD